MIYVDFKEDGHGDVVDEEWFCSAYCYGDRTGNDPSGHAWPGGTETDYDVHCAACNALLWHGLEVD